MTRPPRAAPRVMKIEAIRMGTTGSPCESPPPLKVQAMRRANNEWKCKLAAGGIQNSSKLTGRLSPGPAARVLWRGPETKARRKQDGPLRATMRGLVGDS